MLLFTLRTESPSRKDRSHSASRVVIVIPQQKIQNGTYHQNQLIIHLCISRHISCIYFLLFLFFSLWFAISLWVLKFRVFKCREDLYARVLNLLIFLTIATKREI